MTDVVNDHVNDTLPPRRIYARPPIVEALVEFHLKGISRAFEAFADRLGADYPVIRRKTTLIQVSVLEAPVAEGDSGGDDVANDSPTDDTSREVIFLASRDGTRLLGFDGERVSVHVLAPYPGWEVFREQVRRVIEVMNDAFPSVDVSAVSMRYIDRVIIPLGQSISRYFTIVPPRPGPMPPDLSALHMLTQSYDRHTGVTALLTLAIIPPPSPGEVAVMYDLQLQRPAVAKGLLESTIEMLHERQRNIFESSITEAARELFQ